MCTPREQVGEVHCRGSCHNTVKVIGIGLDRLETLSATGGAAEVVRFIETLIVEQLGELLAHHDTSVHRTVSEIFDDLRVV